MKLNEKIYEGSIINGELVPTQDQIRKLEGAEYRNAHPFVKKSCQDCKFVTSALSWWCNNESASKARGTRRAGCIFCPYWEPDWSHIPKKYKLVEYGYHRDEGKRLKQRYTVIPHYQTVRDNRGFEMPCEMIGYVLWDMYGNKIVNKDGTENPSGHKFDIRDRHGRYTISNRVKLEEIAKRVCDFADELNQSDQIYQHEINSFSELSTIEKFRLKVGVLTKMIFKCQKSKTQ